MASNIFIFMTRKAKIEKVHASVEEIQKEIKELEKNLKILNKLYFINDLYHDVSITKASDKLGITRVTGHNWLKKWNENGFQGLYRKEGSSGQSKLTPQEKSQLKEMILENELNRTKDVLLLIKNEFSVEYSERQVERILKDLNFNYGKPYPVYSKMPVNAKIDLKKKL